VPPEEHGGRDDIEGHERQDEPRPIERALVPVTVCVEGEIRGERRVQRREDIELCTGACDRDLYLVPPK
jgi:hypothetical protein